MARIRLSLFLCFFLLMFLASFAFGQRGGVSTFGAADTFPYDSVDLQSLVTTINIPVLLKGQGPLPGSITLTSPQYCLSASAGSMGQISTQCGNGSLWFIPDQLMDMGAAWTGTQNQNPGCSSDTIFSVTALIGGDGLSGYPITGTTIHSYAPCGSVTATVTTIDGTGITAVIDGSTGGGSPQVVVTSATNTSGWTNNPHLGGNLTDVFSNSISNPGVFSGTFTDSLGAQTTLGPQLTGTSMAQYYQYTDTTGTTRKVNINAGTATSYYNVTCGSTNPATVIPISSISYPDGTSFSFTYESLQSGTIDGLIGSFTTPTGGTITYTRGAVTTDCAGTWLNASLSRQDPDGTTSYTRSYSNGVTTTTVLDPGKNKRVYTIGFSSGRGGASFVTSIVRYQNTNTVASPVYSEVSKTSYCYNNNCATGPAYPITQRDTYEYVGTGETYMSKRTETYDNTYGLLLTDATTDQITGQTITTTYVYGTWNGSACVAISNSTIKDHPCSITTKNGTTQLAYKTFTYNSNGAPTASTEWVSSTDTLTTSYTPNSTGTIASVTLPNNQNISYTYGSCNSLLPTASSTTVNSVVIATSQTWDCNGAVVTSTTDANNNEDDTTYDAMNRAVSYTDRLENQTTINYLVSSGNFKGVETVDPLNVQRYRYVDSLGRPKIVQTRQSPTSSNYDTVNYAYVWANSLGEFTTGTYGPCATTLDNTCGGTSTLTTYDNPVFGPVSSSDANSGTLTWARNSKDFSVTAGPAPSGENTKVVQKEIDGFGRLTSTCGLLASGGTSCGQTMGNSGILTSNSYSFGTGSSTVTTTRGSQTHTSVADAIGRTTSTTTPEAGTVTNTYETIPAAYCQGNPNNPYTSKGDLVGTADAAGNHVCFDYDGLHRVADINNNNQSATNHCKRFRYDSTTNNIESAPSGYPASANIAGRLMEAETDDCTINPWPPSGAHLLTDEWFAYNKNGQITDMWQLSPNSGGTYRHTTVAYDADGTPTSLSGAPNLSTVTYGVDGEDRWNTATLGTSTVVSGVTYDAASMPTAINIGSGTDNDAYIWDNLHNMTQYKFTVGSNNNKGVLTWNSIGSLGSLAITDGLNSNNTQTCTFAYDDIARLTTDNCGSVWSQTYSYDQYDNLKKSGSVSYQPNYSSTTNQDSFSTYDTDGQVTKDSAANTYTWNVFGKMASENSTNAAYDAFGHMVAFGSYEIIYGPLGKIGAFSSGSPYTLRLPAPGGSVFDYYSGNSTIYYYHRDWIGSTRVDSAIGGAGGSNSRSFSPYGDVYNNSTSPDLRFADMDDDTFTKITYSTPHRELLAGASRWLSPDPAGASWNAYSYVTDPNTQTDPSGLQQGTPSEPPCSPLSSSNCWNDANGFLNGSYQIPDVKYPNPYAGDAPPVNLIGGPDPQTLYKFWGPREFLSGWTGGQGTISRPTDLTHRIGRWVSTHLGLGDDPENDDLYSGIEGYVKTAGVGGKDVEGWDIVVFEGKRAALYTGSVRDASEIVANGFTKNYTAYVTEDLRTAMNAVNRDRLDLDGGPDWGVVKFETENVSAANAMKLSRRPYPGWHGHPLLDGSEILIRPDRFAEFNRIFVLRSIIFPF